MLTINERDIVRLNPAKKPPKPDPMGDVKYSIRWHVKKITGTDAVVDKYIDTNNIRSLVAENQTLKLSDINDDTLFEITNELIFPPLVQLDVAKKEWSVLPKLYKDIATAQADTGVMEIAMLSMTTNGNYYIEDDILVPKSK